MTQLEIIKQNYTLLPVIASFDAEGHAKPLFIRVGGESYKIFSCQLKKNFEGISVFVCQLDDHGKLRSIVLNFHKRETVWSIAEK